MHNKPIVIVDICGTLYNSNTTFDFLDFFLKGKSYVFFRKISKTLLWRILNKIIISLTAFDLTRNLAVNHLKGKSKLELKTAMELFYDKLIDRKYENIFAIVNQLKQENRVILASATLDFIAEKIANEIDIKEYFSTELLYNHNGYCTGKICRDLLGNKFKILESERVISPYYMTITDNFSDLDILLKSEKKKIISTESNNKYWLKLLSNNNILNYEIINV